MSGVLDLHALLLIQNGWEFYTTPANKATWRQLFLGIRTEILDKWYDKMGEVEGRFLTHFSPGSGQIPCIVTKLVDETNMEEAEPLGGSSEVDSGGNPIFQMLLRQKIQVLCFAETPEMARVYHVTVRGILQSSLPRLLEAGYISMQYSGSEPLAVEEELAAEAMGVFVSKQLWTAIAQTDAPSTESAQEMGEWWIQAEQLRTVQNPADNYQFAPIDIANIDPETGEPYPPSRILPEEGVEGDAGGVVLLED